MVRIKNRYLLVNILYPSLENSQEIPYIVALNQPTTNDLTSQALLKGLRSEVLFHFGDYGAGAIADNLSVKYLSPATSTFILRVARAHYKLVWAALTLMNTVPVEEGRRCVFRVVRVSGTIRKIEEEAIRRAQEIIDKARCIESNKNRTFAMSLGLSETG
ncbi:Ribonuclease P/MRP protein subunit POP5 [Golovinomyces cichoracearum]|uniref:Ribonuclease P/MRP protein subunit POP5 n=1 Tax=Golovinomyces cichoracearum TaxID=62708 RepID=A0A420I8Y9_9PEZI|nr:Ribonuclease P/MRP protein subunit POP5 [Golovinomyces cichoracearum]